MKKRIAIIVVAFCVSFVVMIGLSVISVNRFVKYVYYSNFTDTSGLIIDNIYQAELHLRDIDRSERGYMLTRDTIYKRYLLNNIDSLNDDLVDVEYLSENALNIKRDIDLLRDTIALRITAAKRNIDFVDSARSSGISKYFYTSRELMRACNRQISVIHRRANRLRQDHFDSEHAYEALTTHTLGWVVMIFCFATLLLFVLMLKELRSRIVFQEKLENQIHDLRQSHKELEEIAYAASHDLKEPLRKIQVFSNMLLFQQNGHIDSETGETLKRISVASDQMLYLIADLQSLANLSRIDQAKTEVDTNRMVQDYLKEHEEKFKEVKGIVNFERLPVVLGYENQLKLLFSALFDNSIKFCKNEVSLVLNISCHIVDGSSLEHADQKSKKKKFWRIQFKDNGIGFDYQFLPKMFKLFQQLDATQSEVRSRGIGLAICQRIMANHEGFITANGEPGEGAEFALFFPLSASDYEKQQL